MGLYGWGYGFGVVGLWGYTVGGYGFGVVGLWGYTVGGYGFEVGGLCGCTVLESSYGTRLCGCNA